MAELQGSDWGQRVLRRLQLPDGAAGTAGAAASPDAASAQVTVDDWTCPEFASLVESIEKVRTLGVLDHRHTSHNKEC